MCNFLLFFFLFFSHYLLWFQGNAFCLRKKKKKEIVPQNNLLLFSKFTIFVLWFLQNSVPFSTSRSLDLQFQSDSFWFNCYLLVFHKDLHSSIDISFTYIYIFMKTCLLSVDHFSRAFLDRHFSIFFSFFSPSSLFFLSAKTSP